MQSRQWVLPLSGETAVNVTAFGDLEPDDVVLFEEWLQVVLRSMRKIAGPTAALARREHPTAEPEE